MIRGMLFACLVVAIVWPIVVVILKLKSRCRRRKRDREIIALAKEWGVWDKPQCLGGRALELKAWKDFKIKREPGESDVSLRHRCKEEHDREIKKTKTDGYNVQIILCDETPPREGGHSNEQS